MNEVSLRRIRPRVAATLAAVLLVLLGSALPAYAQQVTIFSDNFTTLSAANWPTRAGLTGGSVYSDATNDGRGVGFPNFPTGNTFHFGTNGGRNVLTRVIPISTTAEFVTITFKLKYETVNDPVGDVQDATPFEDVDNTEEILVEYRTSTLGAFTTLVTYQDTDTTYRHWATATINVPTAAFTAGTQFRWRQLTNSGVGFDHWAIDDVLIVTNPEPGTWALFGAALAGLGAWVVQRRRARLALAAARVRVSAR